MLVTDTWLRANSGKRREDVLERSDRDGLSVRVNPRGKIVFQMRYLYQGRPKRLDLGSYPLMSLKDARAENERLRGKLEQGYDPQVVRLLETQKIATASTIEQLFRLWYEKYCKLQKANHGLILRSFEIHVFPEIGQLPAEHATLHTWLDLLENLAKTYPAICERVLTNSKQMLKWGLKRKLIHVNVLANIYAGEDFQIRKNEGTRSLSDYEIWMAWRATERSRMVEKNKIYVKLCLFYGCRNGELRTARKAEFNLQTMVWTVPWERHKIGKKTRRPLLRPILPEVVPLISRAMALSPGSEYLFTNEGSNKPMGKGAPLQLPYILMQWLRRHEKFEMPHWSIHDLRKTARTNFSPLTDPHIAERMLGHKLPKAWRAYDHYDYLAEQTQAYKAWWDRLMSIVCKDVPPPRDLTARESAQPQPGPGVSHAGSRVPIGEGAFGT